MKKLVLTLGAMAALCACDSKRDPNEQFDKIFADCIRIETTQEHLIYKCPSDQEWIAKIKTQQPDVTFLYPHSGSPEGMYSDTENTYSEVAFGDPFCPGNFSIRTVVAKPGQSRWNAVRHCR